MISLGMSYLSKKDLQNGRQNYEEQNAIGNWLECVGQIILTLSAQNQLLSPSDPNILNKINDLQKQIDQLKRKEL